MAAPIADPYAAQLRGFTSSIPNARRGLIDLYKLRQRNLAKDWAGTSKMYAAAGRTSADQYAASGQAVGGFETSGINDALRYGYDTDESATRDAVRGILQEGTSPFRGFLRSEGRAQGQWFKGQRAGDRAEVMALQTGLKREQPAALSELEQGIIDTSSNLAAASGQFQSQQQALATQNAYMQQMLQYQGQMASASQQAQGFLPSGYGGGGGGLSAAEQWIVQHESGSQGVYADNPTSSAFGLGQLLLGNRQKYGAQLGYSANTTNYNEQLAMMRAYITDRYGSAEAAMRFWQAHGWY